MKITVSTPIHESPRVLQVRALFDLPAQKTSVVAWDVHLPLHEKPWNLGLIVGPSGCGKSTIARHCWPASCARSFDWPTSSALLDAFPKSCSIKEITEILASVGFSSPPAWLRPFPVLSTGQQFRVTLARLIAEATVEARAGATAAGATAGESPASAPRPPIVFDEYTSVVDRTVAQIGSAAVARAMRARNLQMVAVSCHEDVEPWLNPDWVYRPAEQVFDWRLLRRRPEVELQIVRCQPSAWPLFAPHHYLNRQILRNAVCFLAHWRSRPVAFSAWVPFFGAGPAARREHRTVTLPDYQGIGVGNALADTLAALWQALGYRAISTTTHPALICSRQKSGRWKMTRRPALARGRDRIPHADTRLTASFLYVGPPLPVLVAKALLG